MTHTCVQGELYMAKMLSKIILFIICESIFVFLCIDPELVDNHSIICDFFPSFSRVTSFNFRIQF